MDYKIKKVSNKILNYFGFGHFSGIHIGLHWNKNIIEKIVTFNEDCLYTLTGPNHMQISKIFGISYGKHNINSARFGWRTNPSNPNKIEILTYSHVNGLIIGVNQVSGYFSEMGNSIKVVIGTTGKNKNSMGFIEANVQYKMKIEKDSVNYTYTLSDMKDNIISKITQDHLGTKTKWGYFLFPYFGGSIPTPQDMTISIN